MVQVDLVSGTSSLVDSLGKMENFTSQKIFDYLEPTQPTFTIKPIKPIKQYNVDLGFRMFRNLARKKTWQQQTCQNLNESIFCVINQYTKTE